MDVFEGLNPHQHTAVKTVIGRLLVLAGAGSGKTRVLTLRMAHLIRNLGVSPKAILGLTFTNKAAEEMRHRLAMLIDSQSAKQVTLCTFHSFCMQILRQQIHLLGYTQQFSLYDEKDVKRLIEMIARDLLDHESELPSLAPTIAALSQAKNKALKTEEIQGTGSEWHDEFTRSIHQRLQDSMRAYNAVDFDSLLSLSVELMERHPQVLDIYQERFRYVMIDEYQDTNPIQYRLAALLSAKYQNLCVVGDDDQSIYGWRGADIQNILDFPDATVVKLEQNYRSTNIILKAANSVISNNKKRHGKALWSSKGEGEKIEFFSAPNELNEAQAVVCRMDKLREKHGLEWKDMAILYRSNALSRTFEEVLLKHAWKNGDKWVSGVPYKIFGGTEFYERREIKDLLAYMRVIVNPKDQEALLRVINYPRRGIGDTALDILTAYNRAQHMSLWQVLNDVVAAYDYALKDKISSKAIKGIKEFLKLIAGAKEKFTNIPLSEALDGMVTDLNYRKAIAEEVKSDQMRDFKWQNVQEFVKSIASYQQQTEAHGQEASLHDFLVTSPLGKNWEGKSEQGNENQVSLMTIHSAKGLEFPACFLIGIEDTIIPHEKSMKESGIEEERRLMYVAITRAMRFLTMSMADKRKRMGVEATSAPSRFVSEIPQEYIKRVNWGDL